MKTRILVAAVGLPLLLLIVLALPSAGTAILVAAMCILAVYELLIGAGFCKHVRIFAYSSAMALYFVIYNNSVIYTRVTYNVIKLLNKRIPFTGTNTQIHSTVI